MKKESESLLTNINKGRDSSLQQNPKAMNSPFGNQNRRDWFRQELPMDSKLAVGKSGKTFIVPRNLLPMCLWLSNVHLLLCGICTSGRTVGVRGQLCGVASLLPLLLGSQDWTHITRCALQEPLLTKPAPKVHPNYQLYNGKVSWILS